MRSAGLVHSPEGLKGKRQDERALGGHHERRKSFEREPQKPTATAPNTRRIDAVATHYSFRIQPPPG